VSYIEDLREAIRRVHGVEATFLESVPVKEEFSGTPVWEGNVEVFEIHGHPRASRVYAWAHSTDTPKKPRYVTVLHTGPVTSAVEAVQATILQEFRSLEPTEET
jgi:hypothetical protein